MLDVKYKTTKFACYMTNISMSITENLSPLLFLTFNRQYGISFTLLGFLVLVNFCTQLGVDLLFSFCQSKFNIAKTVRFTPFITVAGLAVFAVMLGFGRTLYSKIGKNIHGALLLCGGGAIVCYLTATLSQNKMIGLCACALTGLCTSMMWPGSLIAVQDLIRDGGVAMFALMAAGGDFGASVGPQMVGVVTDMASHSELLLSVGQRLGIAPDQIGMKAGMLIAAVFPIMTAVSVLFLMRVAGKRKTKAEKLMMHHESKKALDSQGLSANF